MAKDPAFLFYPGDWLGGTMYMTMQQRGCYISLLMLQFNTGRFTLAQAEQVLSICFASDWDMVKQKFKSDGVFYWNERLEIEREKRNKFTNSRRNNALGKKEEVNEIKKNKKHMHKHMEDENESINEFELFWNLYDKKVGKEKAEKKWNDLNPEERHKALDHIPKYKTAQPDKQFRKDPATYLHNKSFNDEIVLSNGQSNTKSPTQQSGFNSKNGGFLIATRSLKEDLEYVHNGGTTGFGNEI